MKTQDVSPTSTPTRSAGRLHPYGATFGASAIIAVSGLFISMLMMPLLVGCGSSGLTEETSPTTLQGPDSPGALAPPGLYELKDGRTQALGTLVYRDIEGGFWAVVDQASGESLDVASVVAVLVGTEELGVDLAALEGGRVIAEGELSDGVSLRMAGPELVVDDIRQATDMRVVPSTR